jgi:hypothetical protein
MERDRERERERERNSTDQTRNLETEGTEKLSGRWQTSPTRRERETQSAIINNMHRNTKMDAETFTK